MARKARPEGAVSVPAASEDFAAFVELFKAEHPEEWEAIKLTPLVHGLDVMTERLK